MRTVLIIILMLAAGATGWFLGKQGDRNKTDSVTETGTDATASKPGNIRGIGKLEPQSGVIKIVAPAGQKIESLFDLEIGHPVKVDQPLVALGGRELRELELKIAQAKKTDAQQQLEFEKSQGRLKKEAAQIALNEARAQREKIASQSKGIELLEAQLKTAVENLNRLTNLRSDPTTRKLVGTSDLEQQQLLVQQLETKISQSKDDIQIAKQQVARAEEAAEIEIQAIEFVLEESSLPENSMDSAINAANKALDLMEIKSPIAGTVLDIVVRPGDTVTNQPVMLIGDTSQMVCVAEINDINMTHVDLNAPATITSIALGAPLKGKVVSKGIMIGPPSMKDPNPFASVDRKTGRVVILLDDANIAKNFVNLQVEVEIESNNNSPATE